MCRGLTPGGDHDQARAALGGIGAGVTTSRPALVNENFQPVLDVVPPSDARAFLEALAPFGAFEIHEIALEAGVTSAPASRSAKDRP